MKHLFTLLFLLVSATSFAQFTRDPEPTYPRYTQSDTLAKKQENKVYICDSPSASIYHKSEGCRGLERCTHAITALIKE